jgi:ketosteroid isomerase-like protein
MPFIGHQLGHKLGVHPESANNKIVRLSGQKTMNRFDRRRNLTNGMTRTFLILIGMAIVCMGGCSFPQKETRLQNSSSPDLTSAITAVKGAYAAFNRGDLDAAVAALDANIEWTEPPEFPGGGTYHGRDGAKRYLAQSRAAWADVISEPERFITAGNRIVVFVHARVKPKGSNEWQETNLADVYTVNEGKIVQMRAFADRQEALRWVGVENPNR